MKTRMDYCDLANEMFEPELAKDVIALMDAEIAEQYPPSLEPQIASIKTLFLANNFYNNVECGSYTTYCNAVSLPGQDNFEFIQNKNLPYFSYVTSAGRAITPNSMSFNGGSIPNFLRVFKTLSPTFYISAYLIHDWLFKCHQENLGVDQDFSFQDTAKILAEGIKTLMEKGYYKPDGNLEKLEKNEDALYLIYLAVRSPIAKLIWDKKV